MTVICSLTLGLVLLSCFYAKDAAFDMEKYLSGLTIADFELSDSDLDDIMNGYDPLDTVISKDLTDRIEALEGLEHTGSLFSGGGYCMAIGIGTDDFSEKMPTFSAGEKVMIGDREFTVMGVAAPAEEQYRKETRSAAVMGNAISMIIALVGVLNFVNSMVTAIVSRRREFAVIQSVGMTKKQLCRMLVFEGLDYAVLTLAASYAVSALAVGIGVRAMVEGGFTTFRFTLLPLGICTPVILIFAAVIPYLCFRNLEKQSVVERLRME